MAIGNAKEYDLDELVDAVNDPEDEESEEEEEADEQEEEEGEEEEDEDDDSDEESEEEDDDSEDMDAMGFDTYGTTIDDDSNPETVDEYVVFQDVFRGEWLGATGGD